MCRCRCLNAMQCNRTNQSNIIHLAWSIRNGKAAKKFATIDKMEMSVGAVAWLKIKSPCCWAVCSGYITRSLFVWVSLSLTHTTHRSAIIRCVFVLWILFMTKWSSRVKIPTPNGRVRVCVVHVSFFVHLHLARINIEYFYFDMNCGLSFITRANDSETEMLTMITNPKINIVCFPFVFAIRQIISKLFFPALSSTPSKTTKKFIYEICETVWGWRKKNNNRQSLHKTNLEHI